MAPSATHNSHDPITARTVQKSKTLSLSSVSNLEQTSKVDIIDIRHDAVELNLKEEILRSLRPQKGPKQLPTLILYDEQGLQLFEEVRFKMDNC